MKPMEQRRFPHRKRRRRKLRRITLQTALSWEILQSSLLSSCAYRPVGVSEIPFGLLAASNAARYVPQLMTWCKAGFGDAPRGLRLITYATSELHVALLRCVTPRGRSCISSLRALPKPVVSFGVH